MSSSQVGANLQTQKPFKTVKDVASFCTSLEGSFQSQLDTLQHSTTEELTKLSHLVETLVASRTDATPITTATPIVEEKNSVAATAAAIRDMQQRLDEQIAVVKANIAKELSLVRTDIDRLSNASQDQDDRIDDGEQYSRRNCLLIHGVAERPDENVLTTVINFVNEKLGDSPEVLLRYEDVDRVHRLPVRRSFADSAKSSERPRPRPIIIKLTRYIPRELIWARKRRLKGTEYLVTESLTMLRANLLATAKEVAGIRNVWTQDGRIVVLCPDKNTRLTIVHERDLHKLYSVFTTNKNPAH